MAELVFGEHRAALREPGLRLGLGQALGTCGEIVQGEVESGGDFLVTLPIPIASYAFVVLEPARTRIRPAPAQKTKAADAVRRTLDYLGVHDLGGEVRVASRLPEGKGMASSSADIVAAIRATSNALQRDVPGEVISEIAARIEPTDAVMYAPLVVAFDHRRGRLLECFGYMPPASIVVIDLGGDLDTIEFNKLPKNYSAQERSLLREAYSLVREGIRAADLAMVGRAGMMSASVNQRLLYKQGLEELIRVSLRLGAEGLVVAHSGSVAGVLFKPGHSGAEALPSALACVGLAPESTFVTSSIPGAGASPSRSRGRRSLARLAARPPVPSPEA